MSAVQLLRSGLWNAWVRCWGVAWCLLVAGGNRRSYALCGVPCVFGYVFILWRLAQLMCGEAW